MSNEKKNSVGVAVATLVTSIRAKKTVLQKETEQNWTKIYIGDIKKAIDDSKKPIEEAQKEYTEACLSSYCVKNSDDIISKISTAVDWSGTSDTLQERLKKVFSSCIANEKKRPKILTELGMTDAELRVIESMVEALKSKSALNITAIDI